MLFSKIESFSANIAFVDSGGEKIYYSKILNDIKIFEPIIKKRSLILIQSNNMYESILSYIASIKLNFVPILVDSNSNQIFFKDLIKKYKPDFLFILENKNITNGYKPVKEFDSFVLYKKNKFLNKHINDNLCMLVSTSGTTGSPKYARISYDNIYLNTKSIINYLKINSNHRTITTLPFSYSYGLSIINTHIEKGACIVLNEVPMTQSKFWDTYNKYKITSFAAVPFNFTIIKKLNINFLNNSYLQYVTVAGGKMDDLTLRYFYEKFKFYKKKLIIMYGQTEASPRISYMPWKYLKNNFGSIGKAIPSGKLSIKNTKKYKKFENHDVGELVYEGKNVFLGYAECLEDLKKGDEFNGKLSTGDLAYNKNNFFYLNGRIKRIIKCAGKRINLDHLENEIRLLDIDCACFGEDDKLNISLLIGNEKLKLKKYLSNTYLIPISFIKINYLKKIPRYTSGKINYKKLK